MKKEINKFTVNFLDKEYDSLFLRVAGYSLPDGCLNLIIYIISELFDNIKEHSFAKNIITEFSLNNSKLFFSVSDDGIGIRNSFLKNGIFAKDDRTSIQLATGGLSTKMKNERAFGLFSIQRLAEKTKGIFTIQSGNSKVIFEKTKQLLCS